MATDDDVLVLKEAAALLRVHRTSLYEMLAAAQSGEAKHPIPFARLGRRYRFSRQKLLKWLQEGGMDEN